MGEARPGTRKVVVLRVGMTHAEARAAVHAAWPMLDLAFFLPTAGYYRDGSRHANTDTAPADVVAPVGRFFTGPPPPFDPPLASTRGTVRIAGPTAFGQLTDRVYATFGLFPELTYDLFLQRGVNERPDHGTVTRLKAAARRQRSEFAAAHGREPTPADRLPYQDGWTGLGVNWSSPSEIDPRTLRPRD